MFDRWLLERRRAKAADAATCKQLKELMEAPLPDSKTALQDIRFVCVDFETTGLDPAVDDILSIGAVTIEGGDIQTASAHYDVVAFDGALDEETLVIHGLTHDALSKGIPLDEAMQRFFALAKGAVLVAHSVTIERGFLDAYCQAHCGAPFEALWVCTLQLERKRTSAQQGDLSVRLGQSRERYNLPRYTAHHALIDALAGAELLLAQAAHRSGQNCKVRDLL